MHVANDGRSVVAAGPALASRIAVGATVALLLAGCQPSGPEALVRGDQELQAGHPAEAIRLLELAATKLPTDAQTWNHLGLAYHAAGRLNDAQKAYLRALNFNRNLADVQYNLGELHVDFGNGREAEAAFRAYLNASPDNARHPGAWRGLGQSLVLQRQFASAETAFGNILRIDPNDADAWNRLGLARVQIRHYRDAYQAFGQAARLDPTLASAHLNLGVTAQQYLGDRKAALQHYRDYLASNPADADAVRRTVHELEVKLGLVRPEVPPAPTNTPPATLARGTSNETGARVVPTNRPAPPSTVVAPTNAPRVEAPRTPVPPAVARTPKPTPVPPPAVATNPPPAIVLRPTNPVVVPPAVAKPVAVEVAAPVPEPANPVLQVVRVDDEPPPVVARDVAKPAPTGPGPALPAARPPDTLLAPPAVLPPAPAAPVPAAESTVVPSDTTTVPESGPGEGKRGFWQKVNPVGWGNPVRWFKKDASKPEVAAPKPTPVAVAKVTVPARQLPRVTPLELPPVAKPVFARYEPARPKLAATGNRAEANAEFQRGVAAHQRHDLDAAMAAYRKAVQTDPSHFEAQHNLAVAALERNDMPTALLAGESAVALDPASANARYNFAVALQRSRHPVDAAEQLTAAAQARPNDANAHLALAALYAGDLEDAAQARREYERVLALSPAHPQADNIRRWLDRNPAGAR